MGFDALADTPEAGSDSADAAEVGGHGKVLFSGFLIIKYVCRKV